MKERLKVVAASASKRKSRISLSAVLSNTTVNDSEAAMQFVALPANYEPRMPSELHKRVHYRNVINYLFPANTYSCSWAQPTYMSLFH